MSRLDVAFLHASRYCAGAERVLLDLVDGMTARDRRVEVWNAGRNEELRSRLAARDVPLVTLPEPRFGARDVLGFLRHGSAVAALIAKRRPATIHANSVASTKYGGPVAAALRVPLVGHVHDEPRLDGLTRRLLGSATVLIAVSQFIAETLRPIRGTRIVVLPNAVDVDAIRPAPAKAPTARLELVTPAAFRRDKRLHLALECAALLRSRGRSLHWRICGPRPEPETEKELLKLHAELALAGCVTLEASLEQEAIYRNADCVVSTSHREPFGLTIIEAHARALPAVGFASGALRETIETERTGLLVPDGDVAALAEAIGRLDDDRAELTAMGRRGREVAEARFSLGPYLDSVRDLHDSLR